MTRSEARAAGLTYYNEGRRLCPLGHQPVKRWVSTGKCFWCARDYERERRRADAANRTAMTKEWRRLNPDKVREGNAKRDPEMMRAGRHRWYYQDRDHALSLAANARAKRKRAVGKFSKAEVAEIMRLQGGKCAYCAKSVRTRRHIDHILPIALGGPNVRSNLQILCPTCNQQKSAKHPLTFARTRGMLL